MLWSSEIIESTDVISAILLPQTERFFLLFSLIMSLRTLWRHFRNELIFYWILNRAVTFFFLLSLVIHIANLNFFHISYAIHTVWIALHIQFIRFTYEVHISYTIAKNPISLFSHILPSLRSTDLYRLVGSVTRVSKASNTPAFAKFLSDQQVIDPWAASSTRMCMQCKEFIGRCTYTQIFRILR